MFEEIDGVWINLQGKDRQKRLEKQKEKCEKENKEFNPKMKIKTELKLHVMYEGWKKDKKIAYIYLTHTIKEKAVLKYCQKKMLLNQDKLW